MAGIVSDHPLWREDGEDGYNQAAEALEKLVPPPSLSLSHSFISSSFLLPPPYFFPPLPLPFSHSFIYSPFLLRPLISSLLSLSPSLTHSFLPPFFSAPLFLPSSPSPLLSLIHLFPLSSPPPYFFPPLPLPFSHSFIFFPLSSPPLISSLLSLPPFSGMSYTDSTSKYFLFPTLLMLKM